MDAAKEALQAQKESTGIMGTLLDYHRQIVNMKFCDPADKATPAVTHAWIQAHLKPEGFDTIITVDKWLVEVSETDRVYLRETNPVEMEALQASLINATT
eukprot:9105142-Heterocapsa_arctica.AAC.1